MKLNDLHDTWKVSGASKEAFWATLTDITEATKFLPLAGKDIGLYFRHTDGFGPGLVEVLANIENFDCGVFVSEDELSTGELSKIHGTPLWREGFDSCRLFFVYPYKGDTVMSHCSPSVANGLALFGITGRATKAFSYHLVGLLAECMEGMKITLCVREADDGTQKVFALRSGGYMGVDQTEIFSLAEAAFAGEGVLRRWEMDHFYTEAVYEFPNRSVQLKTKNGKKAVFVPYIKGVTSDTADASISFSVAWKSPSSTTFLASGKNNATRKHSGDWAKGKDAFKKDLEHLVGKLTTLPDKLVELDAITVPKAEAPAVLEHWLEDSKLSSSTALPKAVATALCNYAVACVDGVPSDPSAAELLLFLFEGKENIPSFKNLSDLQQKILERGLEEVPYCRIRGRI